MWGFQLWVNLPARDKLCPPRYQDIPPDAVPEISLASGATARIVAGEVNATPGAVSGIATAPLYLDLRLTAGAVEVLDVPEGHTAFAYVYEGELGVGGDDAPSSRAVAAGQLAILGDGTSLRVAAGGRSGRMLLVAAKPLNEPIARYGPFVMNTQEEIIQAVRDYQSGRLLG